MGKYDFDEIIDRRGTNSVNVESWRGFVGAGANKEVSLPDDPIRMWIADMDFAVAPEIREAIAERLERRVLGYTNAFEQSFYDALSSWFRSKYDWNFDKESLVFSPGIVPAIYQIVEDLVKPGEKVVTFTPSYGPFKYACSYSKVDFVGSPLLMNGGRPEIDFDDLEAKLADPLTRVFILCNPHNPTGRAWSEAELSKIAELVKKYDMWVISDEIHCDLLRKGRKHIPIGKIMPDYDKVITCMSASKTFNLAGMMMSEIFIRNEEERRRFTKKDKVGGMLNPLSVAAHEAAFDRGGEWLEELKSYIDGNLGAVSAFIKARLPEAAFSMPDATYFAWIDLSKYLEGIDDVAMFFAAHGVIVESGNATFAGNADKWIRLNLAMPKALIEEGLVRIEKAIKDGKRP